MRNRSVMLLATNRREYLLFALNCAESIKLYNPDLQIFIATNIKAEKDYAGIVFVPIAEEIAKLNIEAKIHLDKLIQTEETLFIDSDCLCYESLNPIFEACQGMDVTVIGRLISRGEYWGPQSAEIGMKQFGTDKFILYNGGFYYIRKTARMGMIFEGLRNLFKRYDEFDPARIKNGWKNEEIIFAISLIKNSQMPIPDDARFMTDLYTDFRPRVLNVLKGKRLIRNNAYPMNDPRSFYPSAFSPTIVHFGGSNYNSYPYVSQRFLLKLHAKGLSVTLSSVIVFLFIHIPFRSYHLLKRLLKVFR